MHTGWHRTFCLFISNSVHLTDLKPFPTVLFTSTLKMLQTKSPHMLKVKLTCLYYASSTEEKKKIKSTKKVKLSQKQNLLKMYKKLRRTAKEMPKEEEWNVFHTSG